MLSAQREAKRRPAKIEKRSRAKLRDHGSQNFRGRPPNFKRRRISTRTQSRRRGHSRDRRGIQPGVGGAGRVGQMGRHGRHDNVRAPESTSTVRKARREMSQGPRELEIEAGKPKTLAVHTTTHTNITDTDGQSEVNFYSNLLYMCYWIYAKIL